MEIPTMKKILLILLFLLLALAGYFSWIIFRSQPRFAGHDKFFYIYTDSADKKDILNSLRRDSMVSDIAAFSRLASQMKYWRNIKPGKYSISKSDNLISIIRRLKNGQQTPVNLTIVKLRTQSDLARLLDRRFEFDSLEAMTQFNDSAFLQRFGLDSASFMTAIIPDTYSLFWNSTPADVFVKLYDESKRFWTEDRIKEASAHDLDPKEAYTLASIVEEETNAKSDKPNIASVYLNRIKRGMPLQADPTIKFAMQKFGLKRIYHKYLDTESPYNTYRNKGLPPGPICTPSKETIDAVLNAPQTDYLYFVANKDFSNTHIFTSNYRDHMKFAREYQQALNRQDSIRKGILKE
jgi:peptidoglycan lytic transglycosylase G